MAPSLRWGIVGLGRAGRARRRALESLGQRVVTTWGSSSPSDLEPAPSLDALLERCDAVSISSPDQAHPDQVRAALRRGCQVVVEYPLAGSPEEASELLQLASERGLLLHVAHIELLSPVAVALRSQSLREGLEGGSLCSVSAPRRGTFGLARSALARLHRLVDALGMPDAATLSERSQGRLHAQLQLGSARLFIRLETQAGGRRSTRLELLSGGERWVQRDRRLRRGERLWPLSRPGSLFVQDQRCVMDRLAGRRSHYVSDQRLIEVLDLALQLDQMSPGERRSLRDGPRSG